MSTNNMSLSDNEHIKALISILEQNDSPSKNDLFQMLGNVSAVEWQLNNAMSELATIRQELQAARQENQPVNTTMQSATVLMQNQVKTMQERLITLKETIIEGCKQAVAAFKEKGISALGDMSRFFKIKPALIALRDGLTESIKANANTIAKIQAISAEYHKAGQHLNNMGRAVAGKEMIEEVKPSGKFAKAIATPYRAELDCLKAMRSGVNKAIDNLARLEQSAQKKPSILKAIQQHKEQAQPVRENVALAMSHNER